MCAIKIFFTFLLAGLLLGLAYLGLGFLLNEAHADTIQTCDYKPSQADQVIVSCQSLHGKGLVSVRICGINYTIDIDCK